MKKKEKREEKKMQCGCMAQHCLSNTNGALFNLFKVFYTRHGTIGGGACPRFGWAIYVSA
jgi:hypothetical protein